MKLDRRHLNRSKINLGLKIWLLEMNRRMDSIRNDIDASDQMYWYGEHSISTHSERLTNFEIATLFLEDRRFFVHNGFEFRSALRGLKRLLQKGSVGGISTIDQQVVRISTGHYERTIIRKLNEITLAICLNMHVPKRKILNYYIHNAYVGYRMQGCEVAAKKCFGIGTVHLNRNQAAFIASLYPLPFPKSVWDIYQSEVGFPFDDPEKLIGLAESVAPRWAGRVRYRMNLALKAYDFMPKSL